MADYDEAGYYELQLNNKQLVFFFMAAVAIAVVVFLCGVMVGRGVRDATIAAAGEGLTTPPGAPPAMGALTPAEIRRELDYQRRVESSAVEDRLENTSSSPEKLVAETREGERGKAGSVKKPATKKTAAASPSPAPPRSKEATRKLYGSPAGTFTIQAVALKTRDAAQKLVARLEAKGYRAYLESGGEGGLFRVRVGRFKSRSEAEKVARMLRDQEKFNPYITQ